MTEKLSRDIVSIQLFFRLKESDLRRSATRCYTDDMSNQSNSGSPTQVIFILAGTTGEYTAARQYLKLTPLQAHWLTGPSKLKGLSNPKVYRVGSWRSLDRIKAIEAALIEANAEVLDIQDAK